MSFFFKVNKNKINKGTRNKDYKQPFFLEKSDTRLFLEKIEKAF